MEFDDAFFGSPTTGKKRGHGTEKAKVSVALSLDENGNPRFLKLQVAKNIKQASVKAFAQQNIVKRTTIHSDGYRSYKTALTDYDHKPTAYDPHNGLLHWLHVAVSNAKVFVLGTYHGLPAENPNEYLAEYCFHFSGRKFHDRLFDRLAIASAASTRVYAKG